MRRPYILFFLALLTLAGSAQSHAFQVKGGREPAPLPTPTPARAPRRPRADRRVPNIRRTVAPRFVRVAIVSNLPDCDVAIDDEIEERGTDEQGRLVIPMEPGVYDVRVTKSGYVTEGRQIEVRPSPTYEQEEKFTLRRALLSLKVKTNPRGVSVTLDGNREGVSDAEGLLTFKEVDPSVQHSLRATRDYYREETVTVPPYKREVEIRLTRDLLDLTVKTDPPQAEVYLDEALRGTSDAEGILNIPRVKTDREHSLRASREGFVTQSVPVPPNYEFAFIKLPSVSDAPPAADGRPAPEPQSSQSETGQRPDAREGAEGGLPKAETPQANVPQKAEGPPPAAQNAETPAPAANRQKGTQDRTAASSLDVELKFWDSIEDSDNPEEFAAYLNKYPEGQFAELARIRMNTLLARRKVEPEPAATPPSTGPSKPAKGTTALEEATELLRRDFSAKFTYRYTSGRAGGGGASSAREAGVDVEPLRFEGCRLEWRASRDIYRASLSDLDPLGVKAELLKERGVTYSTDVWGLFLLSKGRKEAFERLEGGRGGTRKKDRWLVLLYDDKEKADRLAAAFKRAIELCGRS